MKLEFALALVAATASSLTVTTNECENEEGAVYLGACKSIYYAFGICEEYEVQPEDSCNVWAFAPSEL